MLSHCNVSLETARGIHEIKRVSFVPRLIGSMLKGKAVSEKPFGKNSPTDKSYLFPENVSFEEGKSKTIASIKSFSEEGPAKCTKYPHPFFGHFTPEQWAVFEWKHLDHHLRQFGV